MELVRTATAAGVTTLTLDSPANRNALSTPLMRAAARRARRRADRPGRPGRWCSRTPGRSSAPAPTSRRPPRPATNGRVPAEMLADVLAAIWEFPKPVVARVGGPARAGGLGLIAAADIAVCTREATFAFSEVRLGVIPAVISATVLPRLAPARRRRALPHRRRLRRRTGRRDRPGHRRGRRRTSWTRRWPGTATRWSAAARSRWPAPSSCCAGRPPAPSAPTWPSCRERSAGYFTLRRGPRGRGGVPGEAPGELGRRSDRGRGRSLITLVVQRRGGARAEEADRR